MAADYVYDTKFVLAQKFRSFREVGSFVTGGVRPRQLESVHGAKLVEKARIIKNVKNCRD